MMRKVAVLLSVIMLVGLVWTGGTLAEEEFISIASGGTGGANYPMAGLMADVINKKLPGVTASVEVTAASVENIHLIQAKKSHIGFVSSMLKYGWVEDNLEIKPMPGINTIIYLAFDDAFFVTLKGSGINSIYDLKGKKISIGAAGSASTITSTHILKAHGLDTKKDFRRVDWLSWVEASRALKDGRIDAGFFSISNRPAALIIDLATVRDIKILPFAEEAYEVFEEEFGYGKRDVIIAETYKGVPDTPTILTYGTLVVGDWMSEDLVYKLVKVIWENIETLRKGYNAFKFTRLDPAIAGLAPLHPGAIKYYKEKGLM